VAQLNDPLQVLLLHHLPRRVARVDHHNGARANAIVN
jgi:hypothetical protein